MPTNLTARITWHDSANNGVVCRDPLSNAVCRGQDRIAEWFFALWRHRMRPSERRGPLDP